MRLKPGKLDHELLRRLLERNVIRDERVVIPPAVGRDVGVVRLGDACLVFTTDPITFATDRIGWYTVHVNANDVATVGARPRWFLVTALLPERAADESLVEGIWEDMGRALAELECDLVGGHTEVTVALDRPVLVGQMIGEVTAERLVDKAAARPGDRVLLTAGVPIEGTAIMAREKGERLREAFSAEEVERARGFLDQPGISVVRAALAACEAGRVNAMHDPTEGGVATGLRELAEAAGCGMLVDADRIPVLEPGGAFCRHFGLDPLGVIASGALLICVAPGDAGAVAEAVRSTGTSCAEIGEVRPREDGVVMARGGERTPIPTFPQDEITKLFTSEEDER